MPKAKMTEEKLLKSLRNLFIPGRWRAIGIREIVEHVANDTGVTYSLKGMSLRMLALAKKGKMLHASEWPYDRWCLPREKKILRRKEVNKANEETAKIETDLTRGAGE